MLRIRSQAIVPHSVGVPIGTGGVGVSPPVEPPPSTTGMKLLGHGDWSMLQNLIAPRTLDGVLWYSPNTSWGAATSSAGVAPTSPAKKYNMTTLRTWLVGDEIPGSNSNLPTLHQRVVNGEFDSGIIQQLNAIASHTPDCYLTTFNEFNGDWFPQYAGWNPTTWIAMFRHVSQLAKSVNSRFKVCWVPSWQFNPNWGSGNPNAPTDLASYWPGDDVVDFVGLDWYDGQGSTLTERWNNSMTHVWGARSISNFGIAHGKRMVFPEWALWDTSDPDWITLCFNFFNEIQAEAVCYFNIDYDAHHHLGHYPDSAARYGQLFSTVPPVTETPTPPPVSTPSLIYADGHTLRYSSNNEPFLWVFDTHWICQNQSNSDYTAYLAKRKSQGFAGLQVFCYVSNNYWPDAYRKSYDGSYPFNGGDPLNWNMNYWNILKARAQEALSNNLFFCLMCGAPGRSEEDWKLYGTSNAYAWGYKIGEHFRGLQNMMFALTLDRHADYNDHWGIAEFRAEAEGIADGWNAAANNFNGSADYSTLFITLHPNGDSRSTGVYWNTEPSNDMNAHQEWGHPDNIYGTAIGDYNRSPARPSTMVEGIYESADANNDYGVYVSPQVINQQAFHNYFARAGCTYGYWLHWFGVKQWDAQGAWNMSRIASWIRARPWSNWVPDQSIITSGEGSGTTRKVAVRNPDSLTWHIYFPNGSGSGTMNLNKLSSGSVNGTWWNPNDDSTQSAGSYSGSHAYSCPYSDGVLTLSV